GLLLRQALPALGAGDDALGFQFLVDASTGGLLDGGSAAEGPAGAVAGRAEGFFPAACLTDQDPAGPAHGAWGGDRLGGFLVPGRDFRMAGRVGARRPLAMHPDLAPLAAGGMLLELGDVVADVVDQVHLHLLPRAAEDAAEDLAGLVHQELTIAPGEV